MRDLRLFCTAGSAQSMLQVVLVGQPQLRETLRLPQLASYAQPERAELPLEPLSAGKSGNTSAIASALPARPQQLFTAEACDVIAHASAGVPRVINILCDTALV